MDGRISATDAALDELRSLERRHGPLMLFLSGGCCEGSSPQCLLRGELLLGPNDLDLGEVDGTPVHIDAEQYRRWNEPTLVVDVADGAADTMSLEGLDGIHFLLVRPPSSPGKSGSRRYCEATPPVRTEEASPSGEAAPAQPRRT